jgi:hypothetical protein
VFSYFTSSEFDFVAAINSIVSPICLRFERSSVDCFETFIPPLFDSLAVGTPPVDSDC